jgi:hypothetical protein
MDPVTELARRLAAGEAAWLDRALEATRDPGGIPFRTAYAAAARKLGAGAAHPLPPPPDVDAARVHWCAVDWVRAALLRAALGHAPSDAHAALVTQLFEGGEIGEGESLLRTLVLLPQPERFLETALLGIRASAVRTFAAIACENAYPSRFFPEASFNQMVLKSIFMEVPVRRIDGLAGRVTDELRRMVSGYASERRAAGRPVPADVDHVLQGARA